MNRVRAAVIGAGAFGRNHIRVLHQIENVDLSAIVDTDIARAQAAAAEYGCQSYSSIDDIAANIDAAVVATPTTTHEQIASQLLSAGVDVLVEKPIASTAAAGIRLARMAEEHGRILQVGHLERFNPAVTALERAITIPLFFEVHRLSVFTPRSLDIDVVLDLMIHDLDVVLCLTGETPDDIRAAGISVLSGKVDIANVRLSFATGCVANLTASRVSTEKVRKLRVFQPGEYISLDYHKQEATRLAVRKSEPSATPQIGFESLNVDRGEPLHFEVGAFFDSVRTRNKPRVDAFQAAAALSVAESILGKIEEHTQLVAETIRRHR
jgi:predicted dehydrogenase